MSLNTHRGFFYVRETDIVAHLVSFMATQPNRVASTICKIKAYPYGTVLALKIGVKAAAPSKQHMEEIKP